MTAERHVITQGEHRALANADAVISTLLGSCVACCLWDETAGVGGMNHMLLASSTGRNGICDLAGVNAMELLINDLLKLGAMRHRLKAKAFGGAQMVSGLSDIGPRNARFVLGFLEQEGIPCLSSSLGGQDALHVLFTPATGAVRLRRQTTGIPEVIVPVTAPAGNDLELF
jgi:chemotaxis protein CheD